jgi:hypothetical protein
MAAGSNCTFCCPDDKRIERVWEDPHANFTRNHTCPNMVAWMREVRY